MTGTGEVATIWPLELKGVICSTPELRRIVEKGLCVGGVVVSAISDRSPMDHREEERQERTVRCGADVVNDFFKGVYKMEIYPKWRG